MNNVRIRTARSDEDLVAVRKLCWAYRDILADRTVDHPDLLDHYYTMPIYHQLMDELPGSHVAPNGEIFVAENAGQIIACGMTHRVDAKSCEVKRVYVAPSARGMGIARSLCTTALIWAKDAGYKRMVLDTMTVLTEAMSLYESMGFTRTSPYHDVPPALADLVAFYEYPL